MGVNAEIVEVAGLVDLLEKYNSNVEQVKTTALKAGANIVCEEAKDTTAFDDRSGELRKSIKVGKVRTKKDIKLITVEAGKPYAAPVEFGTSTAAAHPFLAPAYERKKEDVYEAVVRVLEEALNI